jgi:mannose-1-phosphate guanylyltransferase/phosphomannomutase
VDRSIIWRNGHIGPGAELRGCLLGGDCDVRANAVIFENAVVADQTIVGRGAIIQPNVKIWPHKEIEAGAVVSASIIWGSRGRRVLFGRHGVSGLINVDFTPAMVAKLGSAYASILPVGSEVTLNRDPAIPSRMLKRALASGLASAGVNVADLSVLPVPVAQFYTRVSGAVGGVHIHVSSEDRSVGDINFFDYNGMELDKGKQRSIETAFFREDFRRIHLDQIGTHDYAPGVVEQYTRAFLDAVDGVMVQRSSYCLVVDYSLGATSEVLPGILRSLGCNVIDLNSEQGLTRSLRSTTEYETALQQLGRIVPALSFDLGAMLDVDGERLQVVDRNGTIVPPMHVLAALARLVFEQNEGAVVAVPSDAPTVFEQLAAQYRGKVVRSRRGLQGLRAAATQKGVRLAGDGRGRMIFPALHPQFDAMFGLVQLLELLSRARASLHDVVADLPRWHVREANVPCPWDKKGRVMRLLGEQYREHRVRGSEGIKIQLGTDWVLILPDPDEPQFHLVAEAETEAGVETMLNRYASIVSGLQQDQAS